MILHDIFYDITRGNIAIYFFQIDKRGLKKIKYVHLENNQNCQSDTVELKNLFLAEKFNRITFLWIHVMKLTRTFT